MRQEEKTREKEEIFFLARNFIYFYFYFILLKYLMYRICVTKLCPSGFLSER